ncbi:MAG: hypothetical protein ACXVY6_02795 [Gaiellaceae bacterium]
MTTQAHDDRSSVGSGFVPRSGIISLFVVLLVLSAAILYSLWAFWPTALASASRPLPDAAAQGPTGNGPELKIVHYLGVATFTAPTEMLFFLIVGLSGALGGLIHSLRSVAVYAGSRRLRWSWVPFNLMLPVVGALGGTVFYLVFRAGLFSPSSSVDTASPFGFAAVAVLVGLFSEEAMEKLREIAENLFSKRSPVPDHYAEGDSEPPA